MPELIGGSTWYRVLPSRRFWLGVIAPGLLANSQVFHGCIEPAHHSWEALVDFVRALAGQIFV